MTLDGRSIVAHGRIGLMCRRFALGQPWVCSCATDGEALRIDLGAASYLEVPDPVIYLSPTP